jgi:hypothetical protein
MNAFNGPGATDRRSTANIARQKGNTFVDSLRSGLAEYFKGGAEVRLLNPFTLMAASLVPKGISMIVTGNEAGVTIRESVGSRVNLAAGGANVTLAWTGRGVDMWLHNPFRWAGTFYPPDLPYRRNFDIDIWLRTLPGPASAARIRP